MNKADVIKNVASRIDGCTKSDVETVINTYAEVVLEAIKGDDDTVSLPGLGKFVKKHVGERRGVSQLGEKGEWVKPEHDEIAFRVDKKIKEF